MRKKIYNNMLSLSFAAVIIFALASSLYFSNELSKQVTNEIRNKCSYIERFLSKSEDPVLAIKELNLPVNEVRITLISNSGKVLYDNNVNTDDLDSHLGREEIIEVFETGIGESKRYSTTLAKETYYYALTVNDDVAIRVSKTTSNIYGVFYRTLPFICIMAIAIFFTCHLAAKRLTKNIIDPLNDFDFDNGEIPYEELSGFIGQITHQKQLINDQLVEIKNSSTTIKAINDNMKEGLITVDRNGVILSANKSILKLLGKTKAVIGKNVVELTRNVETLDRIELALEGNNQELVLELGKKIFNIYFSPLIDNGVLILYVDITEKAKREKLRREFSTNVSHELKTPLTSISGYAELLESGLVKDEDISVFAGKIKNESGRLLTLVEDIIRISELDETSENRKMEDVNLKVIANDVLNDLSIKAHRNSITLELNGVDVNINANRQMMYELLYNLVDNAIKYNQEDGKVVIEINNQNDEAICKVIDNGIGIPSEDFDRIFERFYRVDRSRSKKTGGTGLGLSIVKHIVNDHGGRIKVDSIENKGTSITVTLPINK